MCRSWIKQVWKLRLRSLLKIISEIQRLRKPAPSHTRTVALTCVFWVIFWQYEPFNTLWQLRLLTLHTYTHTHRHSPSAVLLMQHKLLTVKDSIAEAVTSGQDLHCLG